MIHIECNYDHPKNRLQPLILITEVICKSFLIFKLKMPKKKKTRPEPTIKQLKKLHRDTCDARLEPGSKSSFESAAKEFVSFCKQYHINPTNVNQEILNLYVAYQTYHFDSAKETLRGHIYGIKDACSKADIELNVTLQSMPTLHQFYKGRLKLKPPKEKQYLMAKQIAVGFRKIWSVNINKVGVPLAYINQVKRAVISAQFLLQSRSNRMTRPDTNGARIKQLEWDSGNHIPYKGKSEFMMLITDKSKTNHIKKLKFSITFHECDYDDGFICAVCENINMWNWRKKDWHKGDPIWVISKKNGDQFPVDYNDMRNWMKDLAKVVGMDPRTVATHSNRRGGDAHARKRGASDATRQNQADWKSIQTMRNYGVEISKNDLIETYRNERIRRRTELMDLDFRKQLLKNHLNNRKSKRSSKHRR